MVYLSSSVVDVVIGGRCNGRIDGGAPSRNRQAAAAAMRGEVPISVSGKR